jgi:hypothetical protein
VRQKKREEKVIGMFIYIIYSLSMNKFDTENKAIDVTDGIVLCELVNAIIGENKIKPVKKIISEVDA